MPRRPPPVPDSLVRVAVRQEGLVSVAQCRSHGLSVQQANEAVARGEWLRVTRGVYDLTGRLRLRDADAYDRARRRMAMLGPLAHPGSIVTGVCALVLHGVQGAPVDITPEVAFPKGSARRASSPVDVRRLPIPRWQTIGEFDGVPVIDALAQAVPRLDRRPAVALIDSALHLGLVTMDGVREAHDAARLRPGVQRTHGWWLKANALAESPAETWARLACTDAGCPPDALQLRVVSRGGRLVARIDLAWYLPDGRWLLVEIDGRAVHDTPDAVFTDRVRQNTILTDRTLLRRFTGAEAWRGTLVTEIGQILRQAAWHPGRPTPSQLTL